MQLALIHISDIHFRTDRSNPILDKAEALAAAIASNLKVPTHCILLVSGDVAFSGLDSQYKVAEEFLDDLGLRLFESGNVVSWEEVYVPGNHDCDLSLNPVSRELLIESVVTDAQVSNNLSEQKIGECLNVQDNFFAFTARRTSKTFANVRDRLAWQHIMTLDKQTIIIRCFNTAWLSRLHEKKDSLLAPDWLVNSNFQTDLDVTVFHHPIGWLDATNGRRFGKLVEQASDLICTGHDHDPDGYIKSKFTGEISTFLEADALQDESNPTQSGFRIYLVNLQDRSKQTISYTWRNNIYIRSSECEWTTLERRENIIRDRFQNHDNFIQQWLNNPGAAFSHPRKANLQLRDIYVYPEMSEWSIALGTARRTFTGRVHGEDLAGYVRKNGKVIIYGRENIGKTALTKVLYTDLQEQNVIPLRLTGDLLTKPDPKVVERIIERQFVSQYDESLLERYRQLPLERKAIIIDDFHKTKLNRQGWSQLIDILVTLTGSLVLVASDAFQIQELRDANLQQHPLLVFKHCWIKDFGQLLRYELINRWVLLGQEFTLSDAEKTAAVKQIEQVMRVVVGRNLMPSYPLFILTILQSHEAAGTKDTATGAFSYHWEILIKDQLAAVVTSVTPDTLVTYLSAIAFSMFSDKRKCLEQNELETVTANYQSLHTMTFNREDVVKALLEARVVELLPDGRYRFSYSYIYYYFVANYFATNLYSQKHEKELRDVISYLVHHIHVDDYANIIIFLFYLTNDEKLMKLVVDKAKEQYANFTPCDYDQDFKFTDRLLSLNPPELTLDASGDEEVGREYRRQVDEETESEELSDEAEDRIKEQELDDYLRINFALKVMQIMGQMVRNVPGSLTGDVKLEIIHEAYLVGLRLMQYVTSLLRDDIESVRDSYASLLQKELRIDNPEELKIKTNYILTDIILMSATSVIQRISNAVGSVHLSETYKLIKDNSLKVPISLIDIAIGLDHLTAFPKQKVVDANKSLEKNYVARTVIRSLVRDYFFKYPEDFALRQSVCNLLGIKVNEVGFVGRVDKKILPTPRR